MLGAERLLVRSRAEFLFLLHNIQSPLRQVARVARRVHAAGALLQSKTRVAHLDPDALLQLFKIHLRLPVLELGAVLVGLGDAVAQGDVQLKAHLIFGRGVVEGVCHRAAVSLRAPRFR